MSEKVMLSATMESIHIYKWRRVPQKPENSMSSPSNSGKACEKSQAFLTYIGKSMGRPVLQRLLAESKAKETEKIMIISISYKFIVNWPAALDLTMRRA